MILDGLKLISGEIDNLRLNNLGAYPEADNGSISIVGNSLKIKDADIWHALVPAVTEYGLLSVSGAPTVTASRTYSSFTPAGAFDGWAYTVDTPVFEGLFGNIKQGQGVWIPTISALTTDWINVHFASPVTLSGFKMHSHVSDPSGGRDRMPGVFQVAYSTNNGSSYTNDLYVDGWDTSSYQPSPLFNLNSILIGVTDLRFTITQTVGQKAGGGNAILAVGEIILYGAEE